MSALLPPPVPGRARTSDTLSLALSSAELATMEGESEADEAAEIESRLLWPLLLQGEGGAGGEEPGVRRLHGKWGSGALPQGALPPPLRDPGKNCFGTGSDASTEQPDGALDRSGDLDSPCAKSTEAEASLLPWAGFSGADAQLTPRQARTVTPPCVPPSLPRAPRPSPPSTVATEVLQHGDDESQGAGYLDADAAARETLRQILNVGDFNLAGGGALAK